MISTSIIERFLTEKLYRIKGASEAKDTPDNFLTVRMPGVTALPLTVHDERITGVYRVTDIQLSNQYAQTGEWTWETTAGALTIDGEIQGTTDITAILVFPTTGG